MSRRLAREIALQSLYQVDFTKTEMEAALQAALEEHATATAAAQDYARLLVEGTLSHLEAIDAKICEYAQHWELSRMPIIDRNVLRIAVYEMLFADEKQPVSIAVNEAVELAKEFGSAKSGGFVNGVLGKMMRDEDK